MILFEVFEKRSLSEAEVVLQLFSAQDPVSSPSFVVSMPNSLLQLQEAEVWI